MAIKPILFNSDMVRAILDGRKTVTRRVVKPQPENNCDLIIAESFGKLELQYNGGVYAFPYQKGDILYVRETWKENNIVAEGKYLYKADFGDLIYDKPYSNWKWKPSIHMPKEAARIFLRVTNVSVARLQDCGNGWCIEIEKEGIKTPQDPILYANDENFHKALREEMRRVWNSTIKKQDLDRYGWDANPRVWVIEFERTEKPKDF